ncbi:MAG: hypothetical protein OXR84_01050 [Magnetovibrio sp.]|nr:hypothetical protein [Magnetovibrio sp.]
MRYISSDPRTDRDILLRGNSLSLVSIDELQKLPLRNLFIEEKDLVIADLVRNYFEAVSKRWPEAWNFMGRGLMLNKTNGFRAIMRIFRPAYLYCAAPGDLVETGDFLQLFSRAQFEDEHFTTELFPPGSSGESALYHALNQALLVEFEE